MPTVIDSLVLEFGMDTSQMTRQQRKAIEDLRRFESEAVRGGKNVEAQGRRTEQTLSLIKKGFLGLVGGASIAGVARFAHNLQNADAAVGRVAHTMNTSTRDVSAWQGAIRQMGGSSESATSALAGMSSEMNTFLLTGQASFLPVLNRLGISLFNQNKQLKTASELYLDIAEAIEKLSDDPARKAAMLALLPGMNQDMINLLIKGRQETERLLQASRAVGGTMEADAKRAQLYQQNLSLLSQTFEQMTRVLTNLVTPALAGMFEWITKLFDAPGAKGKGDNTIFDRLFGSGTSEKLADFFKNKAGLPAAMVDEIFNARRVPQQQGGAPTTAPAPSPSAGASGGHHATQAEMEAYIRAAAIKRGIDPDVAVRVARSEGMKTYVGDRGSSFGPFQLHYGGVAPGMMQTGLGDTFTKQTGLDARDPSTWQRQVDFSLDQAKKGGWGPWFGWKGHPWAGIQPGAGLTATGGGGAAAGPSSATTNIGTIIVNTQATDATGIARDLPGAISRQNLAAPANTGQQ